MINLNWANEQNPRGYTKEQIEADRDRQSQAAQAALQRAAAEVSELRRRGEDVLNVLRGQGGGAGQIADALDWLGPATIGQFKQVLDRCEYDAQLVRNLQHDIAPFRAAQAQRQAAEAAKPKPLTLEERIDRIEKQLGLS